MTDRDPIRRPANAFDKADGFSGQDYGRADEAAEGARAPSGSIDPQRAAARVAADGPDAIPPQAGRRPAADPVTGEVSGAGSGAGGGSPGEDYDDDDANGGGLPPVSGGSSRE